MAFSLLEKHTLEELAVGKKKSEELLKNMQKLEGLEDSIDDLEKTEEINLNSIEEENLLAELAEEEKPKKKLSSKKRKTIRPVVNEFHEHETKETIDNNLLEKEISIINSTLHEGLETIKSEWTSLKEMNAKVCDEISRVTKIVEVERETNPIPVATKIAFALSGIAFILSVVSLIITSSTRKSLFSSQLRTEKETVAVTQRVTNKDFVEPMTYQSKETQSVVKSINPKSYNRLKMTKKH